jgi:PAS domain S-box-containing protein
MTPTSLELQIYYEIAMSIGNRLDIRQMLQESLSVYLRRLNCTTGLVMTEEGSDAEGWRFTPFFSIPRNLGNNAACRQALDAVPAAMSDAERAAFIDSLPLAGAGEGGRFYHLMALPGFGLLLLIRSGEPFGYPVIQSLLRLNRKLADSCIACRQNETIEAMNRRLAHEISERRRAEARLQTLLDEMESRVADRTRDLESANQRLRQEIRDRERTEAALRESEERYRTIYDNIQDIFFTTSLDGVITEVSPSLERLTRYTSGDLLGQSVLTLYRNAEDREAILERLQREGQAADFELTLLDKDGTPHICSLNARLVRDDAGEPVKVVGSLRDITDRRQAEAERRALEKKLARSRKMESLGVLAGGVAHDLNNVLSGIVGFPDLLLLKLPEDSPLAEPIRLIRESGKKAAAIVEDLLTLARRGVVQREVVSLNEVIRAYIASPEYTKLCDHHPEVTVRTDLGEDLLDIKGSPIHLRQTVMNLVSNAAESESTCVRIVTRNHRVTGSAEAGAPAAGEYVCLAVTDDGVGISEAEVSRIFEPFYTKKVMGRSGTGLGMSVVWGTVQDHDGFIEVSSEKGSGAVFTLYFPATREAPREGMSALSLDILRGKGESVLVVDDVADQREIAGSLLATLGYSPTAVGSGEAALAHLRRHPADAILLDMIMEPGMDGLETYRRIQEIRPGQKAVIASGFSETGRVKAALKLGASAYIRKPYSLKELGAAMKKCLLGG